MRQHGLAHQREAVRVQAGGRQAEDDVALADAVRPEQLGLLDRSDAEAGQIERVLRHDAGVLGGLAAEQGAAGAPAALRDALDDPRDALRNDPADREVVQEEQGLGARAHDVVGAHRHEVDPDGLEPAGHARDLELRADAVGRGGQELPAADPEESREPADGVGDLGTARPLGQIGDQRDGLRGRLGIHARGAVGVAHDLSRSAAGADPPARTSRRPRGSRSGTPRRSRRDRTTSSRHRPPRPSRRATGSRANRPRRRR